MTSITVVQPQFLWDLAPSFPQLSSCFKHPTNEHQQLSLENISPYDAWPKDSHATSFAMCSADQSSLARPQPVLDAMPLTEATLPIQTTSHSINGEPKGRAQNTAVPEPPAKEPSHTFTHHDKINKDWKVRRDKILQRNRQAAKRCRQRKKLVVEEIESLADAHAWRNSELRMQIEQLRYTILDLHGEILKHAQCDDEPIKRYLAQRVRKISEEHIVDSDSPQPIDPQLSSSSFAARPEQHLEGDGTQYDSQGFPHIWPCHHSALTSASSDGQTVDHNLFEMISY
ncbi:hypothetical protein ANOM_003076 [Aspergillus nomiae NRRL 13137]|uniref:BZIP domain-containing protein n=1 Tax=Aspergillus nomiae NRRL (strain ATCC 15546 / NRRL 13137 / CBS 260.88 / M93) TaxID=1509407 RepID=A0A0L1J968_ASPN3|nr:uncharacterized protein ANOM_003076 [Aspergillus nomiae NRRL 13137]KNG88240.1 hypothetical protein ANOM_003076 [Aspergillus nomiae NRRL 13137]